MDSTAVRRLDDRVEGALEFVGESLAGNAAGDGPGSVGPVGGERTAGGENLVAGRVAGHHGVDLLKDVSARAEVLELALPALRESPGVRGGAVGQAEMLEVLEPRNEDRSVHGLAGLQAGDVDSTAVCPALDVAV